VATAVPDSELTALLSAEDALKSVETILEYAELADVARASAASKISRIRRSLTLFRARYGLALNAEQNTRDMIAAPTERNL
jgi:hypothetical protein